MVGHNRVENQNSKGKLAELLVRANEYIIQELTDYRVNIITQEPFCNRVGDTLY